MALAELSVEDLRCIEKAELSLGPGTHLIFGANGAGKTTLLNSLSCIVQVASGEILFAGESIINLAPSQIVRLGISQVPEGRQVFKTAFG